MAGAEGFRTADHGLTPIRTETWGGFIFVTFDEAAPPLLEWLGDLPAFLAEYDLVNMQWTHKDVYEVACNWKVWLENAFENYHAMTIHRKHMDPTKPQNWVFSAPTARGRPCTASAASSPPGPAADPGPRRAQGVGAVPHLGSAQRADHPHVVVHEIPAVPARGTREAAPVRELGVSQEHGRERRLRRHRRPRVLREVFADREGRFRHQSGRAEGHAQRRLPRRAATRSRSTSCIASPTACSTA